MQSKTTLLDLDRTASAVAATLQGKEPFTQLQGQIAAFEAAGHDPRDFGQWQQYFIAHLAQDANLATRPAPSAIADAALGSAGATPAGAVASATVAPKPFVQPAATPAASLVKILAFFAMVASLFFAAPAAKAQIFGSPLVVTGLVSAPIQTGFLNTSNTAAVPIQQHTLLMTNVYTNFNYVISYGALPFGQTGSNVVNCSTLTTNFSAAWALATFGYQTNQFAWVYTIPSQYIYPAFVPWGSVTCWTNPTGVLFQ